MRFTLALAVAGAVSVTAACAGDRADRERAWDAVFRAALAQGRAPKIQCTVPPTVCADTLVWQRIGGPEILLVVGTASSHVICKTVGGYRRCMTIATGEEWVERWNGNAWTVTGTE